MLFGIDLSQQHSVGFMVLRVCAEKICRLIDIVEVQKGLFHNSDLKVMCERLNKLRETKNKDYVYYCIAVAKQS